MSKIACLSSVAVLALTAGPVPFPQEEDSLVIAFENGSWFDGEGFEPGTRYVADGVLHREPPRKIGQRIDLQGQWVVPPFGEAHTHLLEPDVIEGRSARGRASWWIASSSPTWRSSSQQVSRS